MLVMKRSCLNFVCAAPETAIKDGKFQRKDERVEGFEWFLTVHNTIVVSQLVKLMSSSPLVKKSSALAGKKVAEREKVHLE
jgi:hypothetical protein